MTCIKQNSFFVAILVVVLSPFCASAQINSGITSPPVNERPPLLQNVGIAQHLDAQIPADLTFVDDSGKPVKLGGYFGRKPLILNLVYFNCTMLCGQELAGLASAMRLIKFDVGNEFDVITVSFDPRETPAMAAAKKNDYVARYGRANAASGWHFLTGQAPAIDALTKAVGFQYQYDSRTNQYAHATAIVVLTPQGRISRYLYGVDFPPKDLRLALVEASQEKIGNPVDAVLLYCYHYNPQTGKYGAVISNILRLAGAVTILIIGGMLLILWRLDRSATRKAETKITTYAQ